MKNLSNLLMKYLVVLCSKPATAGVAALALGSAFYTLARGRLGQMVLIPAGAGSALPLPDVVWASAPSFFHGFAFGALSIAAGLQRKSVVVCWITFGTFWELLQAAAPVLGTFDAGDIVANSLGVVLALVLSGPSYAQVRERAARLFRAAVYGLGLLTCIATSKARGPIARPTPQVVEPVVGVDPTEFAQFDYEPVYMTYESLRKAFAVGAPRSIAKAGKMVVLDTTLFVSEPNQGIHVIDISDPTAPTPLQFISLPGNIDLAAKDGVLYADSFVDLVTIEVDGEKPLEVKRINDTFAWDAYQAIANGSIKFDPASVDAKRGVIVEAKKREGSSAGEETERAGSRARITVLSDRLYAVSGGGLAAFAVMNAKEPAKVGFAAVDGEIETLFNDGQRLYVGTQDGLFIYSVDDADKPSRLGQFADARACAPVVTEGTSAYVSGCSGTDNRLFVVDITQSEHPTEIVSYPMANPGGLGVAGSRLFVCDGLNGLVELNVEDPQAVAQVSAVLDETCYDVIPLENTLVVSGRAGIAQYDLVEPGLRRLSRLRLSTTTMTIGASKK